MFLRLFGGLLLLWGQQGLFFRFPIGFLVFGHIALLRIRLAQFPHDSPSMGAVHLHLAWGNWVSSNRLKELEITTLRSLCGIASYLYLWTAISRDDPTGLQLEFVWHCAGIAIVQSFRRSLIGVERRSRLRVQPTRRKLIRCGDSHTVL